MSNNPTTQQFAAQPVVGRPTYKLLPIIAILILTLIILVGIALLITWLVIKPKQLVYSIENGSVNNFNLKNDHLNASFDFLIRAHNPNGRISIYYDSIEVFLSYDDQAIAFNTLEPFYQPRRNITQLEAKIVATDVALSKGLSKDLWHEKSSGNVQLDVRVQARVRFKVGIWKSKHKLLSILCPSVMVHFTSSKIAQSTYCLIEY